MNKSRKVFSFIIFAIILCSTFSSTLATVLAEKTDELEKNLSSEAVLLMEASTGKVIYENNGYEKKYPASTTKIMTAILAIEHCNLNETATASEFAINSVPSGYSTANIQIGETLSVKDLLYALMLQSANESAVILAEHVSGSQEAFANLMNKKAKEIGCKNTHFVNPNGIHDENHYTTAYDLALIAQYAMKNQTFRDIVKTTSFTLPATTSYPSESRTYANTNNLIIYDARNRPDNYYYKYATGIKTGYTSAAKNCLVASAEKNGIEYISVVLGASITYENTGSVSHRYVDTIALFDYAFDNFSFRKLKAANNLIKTIKIENGIAKIIPEKCKGCGVCVSACPQHIIRLVPFENDVVIGCSNTEKGVITRKYCEKGCIGCRLCEKTCPNGAVKVVNNLAVIDYSLCTGCGACAEKCPRHLISKGKNDDLPSEEPLLG